MGRSSKWRECDRAGKIVSENETSITRSSRDGGNISWRGGKCGRGCLMSAREGVMGGTDKNYNHSCSGFHFFYLNRWKCGLGL